MVVFLFVFVVVVFSISAQCFAVVEIFCLICYSPLGTGPSPLNTLLMIILPMFMNLFVKQFLVVRTSSQTCYNAES